MKGTLIMLLQQTILNGRNISTSHSHLVFWSCKRKDIWLMEIARMELMECLRK
ncbi:unnamed protein product [Linum tenue]|uniref:Uncharacterized protein n=1 Tax=Linum tenue TaxID=586396 RepID=A0AAV0QLB2_9ROSI|nr:unnamed protein product [Linum tenue]